jgi:hypothetical protein
MAALAKLRQLKIWRSKTCAMVLSMACSVSFFKDL